MSVTPHPTHEGWWQVRYYLGGEEYRDTIKTSYEDACEHEKGMRLSSPAIPLDVKVAPAIKDMVPDYLKYYEGEYSAKALESVSISLNKHIVPFMGNLKPTNLTLSLIDTYKKTRVETLKYPGTERTDKIKPRTVNVELNALNGLLKWAAEYGHAAPLHFKIKKFPKRKTRPTPKRILTPDEITMLYSHIPAKYRLVAMLMGDAGARRAGAVNFRAENINWHQETISLLEKGDKWRTLPFTTARLTNALAEAVKRRPKGLLTIGPKGGALGDIRKTLASAGRAAGIKTKVTHHLLRHSFLSNAAMDGVLPVALQQLAGHADLATTMKVYVQVGQTFVKKEARKITTANINAPGRDREKWESLDDDELQRLLWQRPATEVAKEFGVSSVAVGKRARKAGLVIPPKGFWQQVRAGKICAPEVT